MARCLLAFGLVILALAVRASRVHAVISCDEVTKTLMPCFPFVLGDDTKPTAFCCLAVKTVSDQATTKEDRKALCKCYNYQHFYAEKAKHLPDLCGIEVSVPPDPNTDCNRIK